MYKSLNYFYFTQLFLLMYKAKLYKYLEKDIDLLIIE